MSIEENIARVEERIAAACRRSGRCSEDVKLVAVSKTVTANSIRQAYEAGLRHNDTKMVLKPDSEFFRYFVDPSGNGKSQDSARK